MYQEINNDNLGAADEIRAAVSVLVLLGHLGLRPIDDWEPHMNLAISRLEEILVKDSAPGSEEQIQAEISILKSRLENPSLTLQRRFALLRRFEYYYDMSRGLLKFPSYTPWRILQEGDRHEKDYSKCSLSIAFDPSATR